MIIIVLIEKFKKKLENTLMDVAKDINQDLSDIVIMIVNADDEKSVFRMVYNCRVNTF